MKSTGRALSLLLLTMAAVSSGRNAREYFQQAAFQHSPARPEDALVFFTATAPPLICEPEKDGDWVGGDALEADFRLILPSKYSDYTCSFEGNATTIANLNLLQKGVPRVFTSKGRSVIEFSNTGMYCTTDSQLPDEYFHLRIQRPHEEFPVKCRLHREGVALYIRFPGYPTIHCEIFYYGTRKFFNLPGIVEDPFKCLFRVYSELHLVKARTEELLHRSLVDSLPTRTDSASTRIVCTPHAASNGTTHFQLQLPAGSIYDCSFSDA